MGKSMQRNTKRYIKAHPQYIKANKFRKILNVFTETKATFVLLLSWAIRNRFICLYLADNLYVFMMRISFILLVYL